MLKNTENSYGLVAKSFHWILFMMLAFSIVAGNLMASMPNTPEKFQATGLHKSFGLVILLLVLLRLIWRLVNTRPDDSKDTTPVQNLMAHAMHGFLYLIMFAQPLSGILMSQAFGYPVKFFGGVAFPTLIEKNKEIAEFFLSAHGTIWIVLVVVVFVHAGAAIYHHLVLKDNILKRMTFGMKQER